MNSSSQPRPYSRIAKLSPFDIEVSVACSPAAIGVRPTESGAQVVAEYGCVDWFQYPVPPDPVGRAH